MRRGVLRRGEASLEVGHNGQRPFVVSAEGLDVRAVGTAFVVGIEDGGVEVTVEEGVVAVGGAASGSPRPRYIRRNEQFVAAQTGPRKAALDSADIERRGAWRKGLLVRSEEHTSELQSLMRISYAVFCLKKTKQPRT